MDNPYESQRLVDEYLFFHYATYREAAGSFPVPEQAWGFPQRVVSELIDSSKPMESALDIGCAVGASSFELARYIPQVTGVDFSHAFIKTAEELKKHGAMGAKVASEGKRMQEFQAIVPAEIDLNRVHFETGDAMRLRTDLGAFDVVLAANLICRLPEPMRFIERLPELVKSGGQLLLATPFSWLAEFTPEENWLGGHENMPPGVEILDDLLKRHFTLEFRQELPFLIREHSRKFQYGISLGSRWRRH